MCAYLRNDLVAHQADVYLRLFANFARIEGYGLTAVFVELDAGGTVFDQMVQTLPKMGCRKLTLFPEHLAGLPVPPDRLRQCLANAGIEVLPTMYA
jgi:hypothetical protein